jgi:hypothetical protein
VGGAEEWEDGVGGYGYAFISDVICVIDGEHREEARRHRLSAGRWGKQEGRDYQWGDARPWDEWDFRPTCTDTCFCISASRARRVAFAASTLRRRSGAICCWWDLKGEQKGKKGRKEPGMR